jgi:Flp pilus assembly protein TadD
MSTARLDALRRMARDKPDDPRLQFGLAVELLKAGHTREGVDALRAYLTLAEDEGNAWGRLGAALEELGEVVEAREAYRKGVEIAARRGHDALTEELLEALQALG